MHAPRAHVSNTPHRVIPIKQHTWVSSPRTTPPMMSATSTMPTYSPLVASLTGALRMLNAASVCTGSEA